jgi:hypothetical protein
MFACVLFGACSSDLCRESIAPMPTEIEVLRLENQLFDSDEYQDIEQFLQKYESVSISFLHADQYPADSILAKRMFKLIQNPSIDTLYQEVKQEFIDFERVVEEIELGIGRLKHFFPQTRTPEIKTIVTGFYNDLFITNEEIMIGLDFFIGEEATFKPNEIPDYILRRYNKEHLPSIVLKFISSQYVAPGKGDAMIIEMIDYGKSLYLLDQILPCTPQHVLMGYTVEEWDDVFENDDIIWANFIQNEWLYETNHTLKQKFLGERPNVYEIGDKCPGRIGQWLGWQIVNQYVKKTGISVQDLMKETDHNRIFNQSGYKPTSD